ncbi:hypothetical protein FRC02_001064 [Tulasnella sp. 418]|nr:hypothetical protein FRC02_001064 [Tulasnella sp. 418]
MSLLSSTLRRALTYHSGSCKLWQRSISGGSNGSPLAFAFDIDGVLLQGPNVLPAGRRALEFLEGNNPRNAKIPYILMTNGGGVTEAERCERLSKQLGVQIRPSQLVQAHTVLRDLKEKYADSPVLILGGRGNKGREVAESYGFKHAFISLDVLAWKPSIWPFHRLTEEELAFTKRVDFSKIPIKAVIVIHDPLDWALDIQVTCDIIRSIDRTLGNPYKSWTESTGIASEDGVELVFCNPDLLWRSDYPLSRFGQGAFKDALQAVYKSVTGRTYPYVQYGKPHKPTYDFASKVLEARRLELEGSPGLNKPRIYMVGGRQPSTLSLP